MLVSAGIADMCPAVEPAEQDLARAGIVSRLIVIPSDAGDLSMG